jgi:hypothetical protein
MVTMRKNIISVGNPKGRSYFGHRERDIKMYLTEATREGMNYNLRLRMGVSGGNM